MSRISLASNPFLLGFEGLDELVERAQRSSAEGFPPYNILQIDADRYRITLAVAGFAPEDLSVTVEGGSLVVRGRRGAEAGEREFLHRGIALRPFQRSFVLAERMEVTGAHFEIGLLHVDLERRAAEARPTRIPIDTPG
ncbi:Hsp20 family protein [Paralimibaculum aggregatum]|uniref:Hsp20 family protein n=1 Tax=Paralimibaculum aggregatum TaxID=3036245 RepID=A0ABQ6LIR0_9RHOB|nr:Hsp20 family protein [Limibaculum sp. NKW23]GMG82857.1 Hsp20 family protein [Limibaculum sp. NKW23]